MALNKITKTSNGLEMSYHKVVRLNINWLDKQSDVVVYSYQDKAQRNAYPVNPMESFVRSYSGADFPFTVEGNNVEQAYAKLIESKMETVIVTPKVDAVYETVITPAVLDEEGNIISEETSEQILISEEIPEVTEEVETNEFANSEEI